MATPKYRLLEGFEIDDDSLGGLSPEKCFVLGAEWQAFLQKLKQNSPFVEMIHDENVGRLVRLAERHQRFVEHSFAETPGFTKIVVGGVKIAEPT